MPEAILIIDHTDLAKRHSKNKCLIVSSLGQKATHFSTMPVSLRKVILCEQYTFT